MRIRAYLISKISGKSIGECQRWLDIPLLSVREMVIFDCSQKHELCRMIGGRECCKDDEGPHCICGSYWWLEAASCDSQLDEDFDRTHEKCSNGCGLCLSNVGYWHCVCGNLWHDLEKKCDSQMTKDEAASACS